MKRDWINYLDLKKIDIYPIQFANCDRLNNNDVVYIFDEVGSGKTISSGLMALNYLANYDKDVLVITTNALVRAGFASKNGQFLNDWFDKLPFDVLNMKERIIAKNNFYTSFKDEKEYGLVIIDEAQIFLNKESLRYQYLVRNIKASKIVFLTATPIKNSKLDLYTYVDIAEAILGKRGINKDWIYNISTIGKEKEQIICNDFNIKSPVTRYFKDTIMSVNVDGFEKIQARRLLPQVWEYQNEKEKKEAMAMEINKILINDKAKGIISRFVVFTRLVEKEAYQVGEYLKEQGFIKFSVNENIERTYYVVTGENANELSYFSKRNYLPTVLILTYQIAEQGVNLPGYNYVVNYNISSFPSSLEQRFGRIDRMGKKGSCYTEINMCYLLSKNRWDINTFNFYTAVFTYIHSLISYLPAKNTILTPKILDMYNQKKSLLSNYIDELDKLTSNENEVNSIICYFERKETVEVIEENYDDYLESIDEVEHNTLLKFCDDRGIIYDTSIRKQDALVNLIRDIKAEISDIKRRMISETKFPENLYQEVLDTIGDKVFYCKSEYLENENYSSFTEKNIGHFDAINDGGVLLSQNTRYVRYREKFNKYIKAPLIFQKYSVRFDLFFCHKFKENKLESIFPIYGYRKLFNDIINSEDIELDNTERELIIEHSEQFVYTLPFFKLCVRFKEILNSLCYRSNGDFYYKYAFNPFTTAMAKLKYIDFGLNEHFYNEYWGGYVENSGFQKHYIKFFDIIQNKDCIVEASNWYKLAYHYTRKENLCWIECNGVFLRGEKYFKKKEELCMWLAYNYDEYKLSYDIWEEEYFNFEQAYKVAMDGEDSGFNPENLLKSMGFYGEPELPEIVTQFNNNIMDMRYLNRKIKEVGKCISLFYDYIYSDWEKRNLRMHINEVWRNLHINYSNPKFNYYDIWTQGIYKELFNIQYDFSEDWTELLGITNEIYQEWFKSI